MKNKTKKKGMIDFKRKVKILWNLKDSVLCLILLIALMIESIAITQRNMSQIIPKIKPIMISIYENLNCEIYSESLESAFVSLKRVAENPELVLGWCSSKS